MSGVITFISLNLLLNYGSCLAVHHSRVARQGVSSSLLTTIQQMREDAKTYAMRNPASAAFNKSVPFLNAIEKMIVKQPELNYIGFSNITGYNELLTIIQKKNDELLEIMKELLANGENTEHVRFVLRQNEKLEEILTWKPQETSLSPKLPRACGIPQKLQDKIRGGNYVEPGALPWMAQILSPLDFGDLPICGGSLVTRNAVITAAQCVLGRRPNGTVVRLGQVNASTPDPKDPYTKDFEVREIKIHPQYKDTANGYDVALLILSEDANNNERILPICLPQQSSMRESDFNSRLVTAAGWGKTGEGKEQSRQLQELQLQVVSSTECTKSYNAIYKAIKPSMICAGDREKGSKDACKGDAGGPLMLFQGNVFLVGIVSFGSRCDSDFSTPGVYTRVTEFLDWIIENI